MDETSGEAWYAGKGSTGPRTAEAKARAARNAVKHGLRAKKYVFTDENADAFHEYRLELMNELAPQGTLEIAERTPAPDPDRSADHADPARSHARFRLNTIGNHAPIDLDRFIVLLEKALGKPAIRKNAPAPAADVIATFADVSDLKQDTGFRPSTPLATGIGRFLTWYKEFYWSGVP